MSLDLKLPIFLPDGIEDPRVPTHAKVVVAAPDGHLCSVAPRYGVVLSKRKGFSAAVHCLEHPVGVVLHLLCYFVIEEAVVVKTRPICQGEIMS